MEHTATTATPTASRDGGADPRRVAQHDPRRPGELHRRRVDRRRRGRPRAVGEAFGLSSSFVGVIGAFSSNAISAGVGALIGGWLCDRLGRKRIYQWDLLLYAFGLLWIIFARRRGCSSLGYVLAGLAVGADVPASLDADRRDRARQGARPAMAGVAQVLWMIGPLVVLLMAFALSGLGVLGIRIVFAHLLVSRSCCGRAPRDARVARCGRQQAHGEHASGHARELPGAVHAARSSARCCSSPACTASGT